MYGIQIGTLELIAYEDNYFTTTEFISNSSTTSQSILTSEPIFKNGLINSTQVIWSKTGRQKNDWLFANVTLPIGNYTVA